METATNYRYSVKTEGVRMQTRESKARIGVHDVVAYPLLGREVDGIRAAFPNLSRAQIFEFLAYYQDHQAESDCPFEELSQWNSFSTTTCPPRSRMLWSGTNTMLFGRLTFSRAALQMQTLSRPRRVTNA